MVVRKYLPLSQRRYLAIKETYNERNQLHFTKESSREEKEKTRGTDNARFHSGRNPTRHRCSPSRAKKSCRTSATLSQPFTIRSRETYRFHGSDPFTKEAWSMHFSPRRLAPVCVCVSSFPRSFSSLRIVSRTIEYPAWVVEPARIVFLEKALPFLRCYFLFAPFKSVNEGTRKLAFVGAANSKGGCANAFLYAPLLMTGLPL